MDRACRPPPPITPASCRGCLRRFDIFKKTHAPFLPYCPHRKNDSNSNSTRCNLTDALHCVHMCSKCYVLVILLPGCLHWLRAVACSYCMFCNACLLGAMFSNCPHVPQTQHQAKTGLGSVLNTRCEHRIRSDSAARTTTTATARIHSCPRGLGGF